MTTNKKELFWADQLADLIIERAQKEKVVANFKCQQTPSGGKHIGNLNDVARCYFPYKIMLERGHQATFVHTTDDRDPLKDVPRKLPDLEANWHLSEKLMDMKPFLGMPLCRVPDPFGCCKSWSEHFTKVWMDGVYVLDMNPKLYSVDELYKQGKFEPYIRMAFEKREEVGKLVSKFQQTKSENYIPFDAICPKCGQLANIDDFNLDEKKVHFVCGGKSIKKKKSEGCGYEGWVSWSEGKLQWRFEWPALWGIFKTTFEPFGKDHAEGSWPSGQEIARKIYGIEPPIPFVYEFFLVNGEKMSASVGNVYIVQDMLKIVEPEIFMYFYTKRPGRQRDLDLAHIYHLVDDFEKNERIYFGLEKEANERERDNMKRMYECSSEARGKPPLRVPYTFAAIIGQLAKGESGIERAIELLKFTGHVSKITEDDKKTIARRLELASYWALNYAAPENRLILNENLPEKHFAENEKSAVIELLKEFEKDRREQELQSEIYEIARRNSMEPKDFFKLMYQILLSRDSGPRLGPFMIAIGKDRVRKLLEEI